MEEVVFIAGNIGTDGRMKKIKLGSIFNVND